MFSNCGSLKSWDLSNFNFTKINSFLSLFEGCGNLVSIDNSFADVPLFDMMSRTFMNCKKLESIKLPRNLENVRNLENAFANCEKLEYINLTPFNNSSLEYADSMFSNCYSLKIVEFPEIYAFFYQVRQICFLIVLN